jgi:hypothetical protein
VESSWYRTTKEGLVNDAIESFIKANDATQFINQAYNVKAYGDLIKCLLMVMKKVKELRVDSKLIYAYAKID